MLPNSSLVGRVDTSSILADPEEIEPGAKYGAMIAQRLVKDIPGYGHACNGGRAGVVAADDRFCTLVMIGVLPNGEKELLAVEDGYRESAESWKAVLRELKRRGVFFWPSLPKPMV